MKHLGLIVGAIMGVMLAKPLFDLAVDGQGIQTREPARRDMDTRGDVPVRLVTKTGGETSTLALGAGTVGGREHAANLQAGLKLAIAALTLRDDAQGGLLRARRLFSRPREKLEAIPAGVAAAEFDLTASLPYLRSGTSFSSTPHEDLSGPKPAPSRGIEDLMQDPATASESQVPLIERIAVLENTLNKFVEHGRSLEDERDFLNARIAGLKQRLSEMDKAQRSIVERLTERIQHSIDTFEQTVAMTGIDVDRMLSAVNADVGTEDSGGPFIAGDYILMEASVYALKSSVALLDLRLDRWEGLQTVVRSVPFSAPLDQFRITSRFGRRHDPVNGRTARHYGLDLAAPRRSPIWATASGQVTFAGWKGHFGRVVEIDHGHGIRTRYAHLDKILVKTRQKVGHREKIGLLGSSGRSTGPHVHYEVEIDDKLYDPMKFLKAGQNAFKE